MAATLASATDSPSRKPELMWMPSPANASPVQPSGRATVSTIGEVVGRGEVPVALVLAGHGHHRPGAVGRPARSRPGTPARADAVNGLQGVGTGEASTLVDRHPRSDSRSISDRPRTSLDERLDLGASLGGRDLGRPAACSGASTQNVMPKLVSGRVVNTRIDGPSSTTLPSASQIGMSNSAPSDRPIQLRCWTDDALGPVDECRGRRGAAARSR